MWFQIVGIGTNLVSCSANVVLYLYLYLYL